MKHKSFTNAYNYVSLAYHKWPQNNLFAISDYLRRISLKKKKILPLLYFVFKMSLCVDNLAGMFQTLYFTVINNIQSTLDNNTARWAPTVRWTSSKCSKYGQILSWKQTCSALTGWTVRLSKFRWSSHFNVSTATFSLLYQLSMPVKEHKHAVRNKNYNKKIFIKMCLLHLHIYWIEH